jgi:micrococcal nuclease
MKYQLLFVLILSSTSFSYAEEEIRGVVTKVIDGNTIEVRASDETYKVLLHGIDSPEPGQHYAEQARTTLEKMLLKKDVVIVMHGKDRFGNRIGEIRLDGAPDPRKALVAQGLAWTSEKEPIKELELLREEAQVNGKGLWGEEDPTPPWIFRRQQTMMSQKSS